ncbi:MAG: hypothetical protein LBJ96_04805 [Holosporaceae bacterium]|nr:hypothetical protein [Holosporaceae bacterium]
MRVFFALVFASCFFVESMNREPFDKVISNFRNGNYDAAVSEAVNLGRGADNTFKNDSRFFLCRFFKPMLSVDENLRRFHSDVSSLCTGLSREDKLNYYSDYATMMAVFENFAFEKSEDPRGDWFGDRVVCIDEDEDSDSYEEIPVIVEIQEDSEDEDYGLGGIDFGALMENARRICLGREDA